jgi:hypothetical protein
MNKRRSIFSLVLLIAAGIGGVCRAQQSEMSFFVTSTGSGRGADLGGLAGADRLCQQLAQAVGAGSHTWHAYLSTQAADGQPAINARDRIGRGPWRNSKGVVIARDVDELHGSNNLTKQTALTEKGDIVNGRGDTPNRHDALTGTQPDGRAFPSHPARTEPAITGRAARKGRPLSATSTGRGCATMTRRGHGIRRIPRAAPTGAAARPISAAPAATACSIALRSTDGVNLPLCTRLSWSCPRKRAPGRSYSRRSYFAAQSAGQAADLNRHSAAN